MTKQSQLRFNLDFTEIVKDGEQIIKDYNDVPENIKEFIKEISSKRMMEDDDGYYCQDCIQKLSDTFICPKCGKVFDKKYNPIPKNANTKDTTDNFYYGFFNIENDDPILYIVGEHIYYNNPFKAEAYKTIEYKIYSKILITSTGFEDLIRKNHSIYKDIKNEISVYEDEIDLYIYEEDYNLGNSVLYTDNLDILKDTIYKYSYIWKTKNYLKDVYINLLKLAYYPLYVPQFEYLVKYKLYNLAYDMPYLIEFNKNFENTFGLDKNYLKLMQTKDVSRYELDALKHYKTFDYSVIEFACETGIVYSLPEIKAGAIKRMIKYIKENKILSTEYMNYLTLLNNQKLPLDDSSILFPKDFMKEYDKLYTETLITKNPMINSKIKSYAKALEINKYEDNDYIIVPASDVESLIEESSIQHNCVRTYCKSISEGKHQIYFMRKKSNIDIPYVTIEVENSKIKQAYKKYNKEIDNKVKKVLEKWEENLVQVEFK